MRVFLLLVLLGGCSCRQRPATEPETPSPEAETPAPEPEVAAPSYEVHEWGLINVAPEGTEYAAGPGQPAAIQDLGLQGFGKPVLYFHLAEDSPSFDVRVDVALRSFRLGEHYPRSEADERNVTWSGRLEHASCSGERTYPAPESELCQGTGDGYCESAELADYETADHSCFHIGDAEWPLLFYRGLPEEQRPALPLELRISEGEARAQRAHEDAESIGKIWYIVDEEVRAVVDWPAPGESIALTGEAPENPRALMHAELLEHGLSEEEAQAFGRAWFETLFGPEDVIGVVGTGRGGGGTGEGTLGLGNRGGSGGLVADNPSPVHRLVYWLPEQNHEAMAHLEFDPAPRAVRRATLVRAR